MVVAIRLVVIVCLVIFMSELKCVNGWRTRSKRELLDSTLDDWTNLEDWANLDDWTDLDDFKNLESWMQDWTNPLQEDE